MGRGFDRRRLRPVYERSASGHEATAPTTSIPITAPALPADAAVRPRQEARRRHRSVGEGAVDFRARQIGSLTWAARWGVRRRAATSRAVGQPARQLRASSRRGDDDGGLTARNGCVAIKVQPDTILIHAAAGGLIVRQAKALVPPP